MEMDYNPGPVAADGSEKPRSKNIVKDVSGHFQILHTVQVGQFDESDWAALTKVPDYGVLKKIPKSHTFSTRFLLLL